MPAARGAPGPPTTGTCTRNRPRNRAPAPPPRPPTATGERADDPRRCSTAPTTATWPPRRSGPVSWTRAATTARSPRCTGSCAKRGQIGERRRQATHPARKKPELMAEGPNEIWTWDMTRLRTREKGVWLHLYVIIDIYSRKALAWTLAAQRERPDRHRPDQRRDRAQRRTAPAHHPRRPRQRR